MALGQTVSLVKDSQGMVWSWGMNKHGELGFGDKDPR